LQIAVTGMMAFFERLLNTSMYSPHGICLLWEPELIWLHVVSDALIALAYFSIPFVLAIFVSKRRDVEFGWVFWAFAIFIMACGVTHVMSIYTLWVPIYGIEGLTKAATALASVVTAVMLWPLLPKLLAIPSPSQLQQAYAALEREGRQRRGVEEMLQKFRDVEATESQVRQAQKMEAVGQLTGGVAHDFNNILTVITGTIEILADGLKDRPQLLSIARMIDSAATRGADLTQHLLAFARRQPLQPRSVDVNALIVDSARLLKPTLGEHIDIEPLLAQQVAPALIDPGQLSTAILNLALNARDAMPNGGKLTLETRNVVLDENYARSNSEVTAGNYVMIAVSDTGEGMPPALLDKVFEPFFTTKEVGKGSGLGLSMVYGFVKQSNGHIKIYSEVDHGTTVKLYLPQAAAFALANTPIENRGNPERGGETILVVEDDPLVRQYVLTQIQSLGYATLSASNGAEALAVIDSGKPIDLLFTDVIMPGNMNGRELAEAAVKRRPEIRVLFTSGYTENAIIHHGRLDAGVLLLAKPYRRSDLATLIRAALVAPMAAAVR
jgi:signal transduction histidine kinase/ActR/RegA family two-component response regulator